MCQGSKGERHNDQNVAAEGEAEIIEVLMEPGFIIFIPLRTFRSLYP